MNYRSSDNKSFSMWDSYFCIFLFTSNFLNIFNYPKIFFNEVNFITIVVRYDFNESFRGFVMWL